MHGTDDYLICKKDVSTLNTAIFKLYWLEKILIVYEIKVKTWQNNKFQFFFLNKLLSSRVKCKSYG